MDEAAEPRPARPSAAPRKLDDLDRRRLGDRSVDAVAAAAAAQAVAVWTRMPGRCAASTTARALGPPAFVCDHPLLDRKHVAVLDDQIVAPKSE